MKELKQIHHLYKLKEINRVNTVGHNDTQRQESSAEHSWSTLILADYLIDKYKIKLNKLKVFEYIIYHDVVEIEAGDTFVLNNEKQEISQKEKELIAHKSILKKIPFQTNKKYKILFNEYENNKTLEAKFAMAIDKLDPIIQAFDKKEEWKKYKFTKQKLIDKKQKFLRDFPDLLDFFNQILEYFEKEDYFYRK